MPHLSKKSTTLLILGAICVVSFIFNNYQGSSPPLCLNSDEVAHGYNALSVLTTGKDEYGQILPLRFKSFGEYKMPLYTYLSVPFVGAFGLSDFSTRAVNMVLALFFPLAVYGLAWELFQKRNTALAAALIASVSLGLHIAGRHAHEAYLSMFWVTVAAVFLLKALKRIRYRDWGLFCLSLLCALLSYHASKLFALYFVGWILYWFTTQRYTQTISKKTVLTCSILLGLTLLFFGATELIYKSNRIDNLLLFNNQGFSLKINELRGEGGHRMLYNKITLGVRDVMYQHVQYFSPQFLAIHGDNNSRFGYPSMAPMTLIEYLFIFIGIYYVFKHKERWRFFALGLFLISPLTASLSWAEMSLTRSLFIFIISAILSGYGLTHLIESTKSSYKNILLIGIIGAELFFLCYSWNFYLYHYPKRAFTIRAWQCGYRELTDYIRHQYNTTDTFYITKKNGQPYIYLLYYLQYPPEKYQSQAILSAPDEYGFGQVERFDKFEFRFHLPLSEANYIAVGYPDDFAGAPEEIISQVQKIKIGTEEIFWIYKK